MESIERLESEVRGYCRAFPTVFQSASGYRLKDDKGKEYIDFFAGAGVLNYGHNPEPLKKELSRYIEGNGLTHSLDMASTAKEDFLETLHETILKPRGLEYKVQFPGPTGTNAIEAALKLARKVTGRTEIISFTNGFHGMTLGSLSVTGNLAKRSSAGVPLGNARSMPFDAYFGEETDTIKMLEKYLEDQSSGVELPAAFVLETVQAEGGINVASWEWLSALQKLARRFEIPLIVDDVQVGCGRTGSFFSFEKADLYPDIVCLSKSLSGYGLPFAVTLIKPELDQWDPGEHNGTFRGHNLAFVTATQALKTYWKDERLASEVKRKGEWLHEELQTMAHELPKDEAEVRGRGMIQGLAFKNQELAGQISAEAFRRGLVIETAGAHDEVLKFLPPLTIDDKGLERGLQIIRESLRAVWARQSA